jgi:hypothetical protein
MWLKEKFEIKKKCHILRKKVMKLSWFLQDLVKFIVFFLWNCHIYLVGPIGLPTINGIPRFFYIFDL